jgi:hypothetical protein
VPRQPYLGSSEDQRALSATALAILPVAGKFGRLKTGTTTAAAPGSFSAAAVKP